MLFEYESIIFKQVMEEKNTQNDHKGSCPISSNDGVIDYVREGQLCPICSFARLVREPGNIIRCPICGYGNGAGCT